MSFISGIRTRGIMKVILERHNGNIDTKKIDGQYTGYYHDEPNLSYYRRYVCRNENLIDGN